MPKPPSVRSIPIKDRASYIHVGKGRVDVKDGAFILIDKKGIRTLIPVGKLVCLFLEPGIRISHRAVKLAADAGTLLIWTGEGSVRFYAAGQPGGARADKLLRQAALALDPTTRIAVVRHMFSLRFGEEAPQRRSIEQLRGIEGKRVRQEYEDLAEEYGIEWNGRSYDRTNWKGSDCINRCLSAANACLYGLAEAAILVAGYSPSVGFLHSGKARSFVFDVADLYKSRTTLPTAFLIASTSKSNLERHVRIRCRDIFRQEKLLQRIVPDIEKLLDAGGPPKRIGDYKAFHPAAFIETDSDGNPGHRV
jgi:CRISPR-associated protein Cas1